MATDDMQRWKRRTHLLEAVAVGNRAANAPPRRLRLPQGLWGKVRYEIKHSNKAAYIFIAPVVIDFLLFTVYLVARALVMAFQDVRFGEATWVGLWQFSETLHDARFWNSMKNTVLFTGSVVPGGIFLGLILAELISRRSPRAQVFFKGAYYLPTVVSTVVLSTVWIWIYQPFNGILNYIIGLFGFDRVNWLGNPHTALPAIVVMSIVGYVGIPVVFITAAMGAIPQDLYDSARTEGAGDWTRFWQVTVPLLRPTLLYLFVVGFIGYFQVFEQVFVMTYGGPGYPGATQTIGFLVYLTAFTMQNWGRAAAQSILLFVAILIFSVFQVRIFAAELEY